MYIHYTRPGGMMHWNGLDNFSLPSFASLINDTVAYIYGIYPDRETLMERRIYGLYPAGETLSEV